MIFVRKYKMMDLGINPCVPDRHIMRRSRLAKFGNNLTLTLTTGKKYNINNMRKIHITFGRTFSC